MADDLARYGRARRDVLRPQPNSELPSPRAQQAIEDYPTDQMLQDFVKQYGFEALQHPSGRPPPDYVPMPRPRYPDLDPNNPLGPLPQDVPPGVTLRPQDIIRQQLEGQGTRVEGQGAQPEAESTAPSAGEQENAPGPSDEQMLETVRQGMGGDEQPPPDSNMKWQDVDEDRAALEANPTPENAQAFADYWGPDELPAGSKGLDAYLESVDQSQRPR